MQKAITLAGLTLASCADDQGTKESDLEQTCSVTARFTFPDGTVSEYAECTDVLLDATYEFDPDKSPEIRSFKIQFTGTDDPDFECWLIVTAHGVCGSGRYGIGSSESTQVEFATYDCINVADEYEGRFRAQSGTHVIDVVEAGDRPGNFEGESLYTTFRGNLEAETSDGIRVELINYDISAYIRGTDAEETRCLPQD